MRLLDPMTTFEGMKALKAIKQASNHNLTVSFYTKTEGGVWIEPKQFDSPNQIHSMTFSNGQEWDQVEGWRLFNPERIATTGNNRAIIEHNQMVDQYWRNNSIEPAGYDFDDFVREFEARINEINDKSESQ